MLRKGQEQLKVLMGGRGGGGGQGGGGPSPFLSRGAIGLGVLVLFIFWLFMSFYRVDTSEQSVELLFGRYIKTGNPGLNFAPGPVVTKEVRAVTRDNTINIGSSTSDSGLMLTGDENIVDIDFQVVWNISDLPKYLFNISEPEDTIRAVAESAMREIIAQSTLAPILNRDREAIAAELKDRVQHTLDGYESGVRIKRIILDKADPPKEVIDAFREVQAAEQTRDTLQKQADAYSNKVTAAARGKAAQLLQEAQGYSAQVVNQAEGEASRFDSVYKAYAQAKEVTRKRLYLETMEEVLGSANKVIMDEKGSASGVVPYLPLNQLAPAAPAGSTSSTGGSN